MKNIHNRNVRGRDYMRQPHRSVSDFVWVEHCMRCTLPGHATRFVCGCSVLSVLIIPTLLSDVDGNSAHLAAGWSSGEAPGNPIP